MKVKSESEVTQSFLTLPDPMDCRPPGSSVHGIFQARVLEWVAIAFSETNSYSSNEKGNIPSWDAMLMNHNYICTYSASQVALMVKNLPVGDRCGFHPWGDVGRSPGGGYGNPLQDSCLENHMDRGTSRATVHRIAKSWIWLKQLSMHGCIYYSLICGMMLNLLKCNLQTWGHQKKGQDLKGGWKKCLSQWHLWLSVLTSLFMQWLPDRESVLLLGS